MTNEYRIAKMHFKNNEFTSAWKCIETVSDFESNRSFLFLWGYSKYMVFAFVGFHGKAVQEKRLLEFHQRQQDNLFEPYPTLSLTDVSTIIDRLQPYVKDGCSDAFLLFLYGLCVKESDKHQALRCFTTSVRESISVILITHRFPLFWGAWEELLSIVTTRSTLLYVLNNTHESIIRDFFWIALSNRMNEVGGETMSLHKTGVPQGILDRLQRFATTWWFCQYQLGTLLYHKGGGEAKTE